MPLSRSLTQPSGTIEYAVLASDTLNSVAAKFQTTPTELSRINRITGRIIFPGQILFVPKRHHGSHQSTSSERGPGSVSGPGDDDDVPPNTPNTANSGSESSLLLTDNPVPGQAIRIRPADSLDSAGDASSIFAHTNVSTSTGVLNQSTAGAVNTRAGHLPSEPVTNHPLFQQHHHSNLYQTASLPFTVTGRQDSEATLPNNSINSANSNSTNANTTNNAVSGPEVGVASIDPADRECLERFLKINVRYITDGQGVVPGVLLITPNALMFDPYVSDPLVIERGREFYGVTVPIELVLKTAMYSDIAHMRVKHAPEHVPSFPKPAVYFADDKGSAGGIVDEDVIKNAGSGRQNFDTILKEAVRPEISVSEAGNQSDTSSVASRDCEGLDPKAGICCPPPSTSTTPPNAKPEAEPEAEKVEFSDAKCNQDVCDSVTVVVDDVDKDKDDDKGEDKTDNDTSSNNDASRPPEVKAPVVIEKAHEAIEDEPPTADESNMQKDDQTDNIIKEEADKSVHTDKDADKDTDRKPDSEDETEALLRRTGEQIQELYAEALASESSAGNPHQVSIDLSETSASGGPLTGDSLNLSLDDESKLSTSGQRLSSYFQTKLALAERHSAPLNQQPKQANPPLVTAISADADEQFPGGNGAKRRSAAGESRREQMLKRLSNPVDKIGSMTKSGFNSSINATKSGINATKTGITSGIMATKSGLTTGLSVTKTGFTKVLSTPKNLMDFSSGLLRDSRGALATGSKSENDLSEHSLSVKEDPEAKKRSESSLGYTNMVDCKVDAFDNFDKLIPKQSSKHNKDPPLYLCIRMGKFSKNVKKHRFVPAFSFGKKKYEREYWFSVPKDKAKNLYYFFLKWAPEVYGDVDDVRGSESRCLEPINTDDELELEQSDESDQSDTELIPDSKGIPEAEAGDGEKKPKFWRRRGPMSFLKLVEDHFSTEGTSAEWNISNSSEDHSLMERFGAEPAEPILPDILGQTELLTTDIVKNLSKHLPARAEGYAWSLIYSTSMHGFSLNSLYREMKPIDTPVLLIVEDTNGARFGALLSSTIQMSDHFYGTGETFVYTFFPEFALYPWTGENLFFIKGNTDSISIGAGEGNFGLWLDGDLYHGSSHPCKTFGNQTLSSEVDFVVKTIECWAFT